MRGSMKIVPRAEIEQEPLLRGLGPEPLGNEFDAAMLARACAGKKTSLKAALLDQTVGSQVLIVAPPSAGYPEEGTLVFVVDILDVWNPVD